MLAGQENKKEQKIKIVINDGSGSKIVVDTLLKGGMINDSIKLKDGKVIYIGDPENVTFHRTKEGPEHIFITVDSDGEDNEKEVKEITVISSDSVNHNGEGEYGRVYVYSGSKGHKGRFGGRYKVVTSTSDNVADKGEKYIYINEGRATDKETDKTFDVYVSRDDKDSDVEMTRFVIAKDGMVVTVEGKDEAKAKELVKEIQEKMGVKGDGPDKKETIKVEAKKHSKK
jgi:hypothetical protein